MKWLWWVLELMVIVVVLCLCGMAGTKYVIVNNNNAISNNATLYKLKTSGITFLWR